MRDADELLEAAGGESLVQPGACGLSRVALTPVLAPEAPADLDGRHDLGQERGLGEGDPAEELAGLSCRDG
jgi:hypothetical protein